MNVDLSDGPVVVTLSRRNLQQLLDAMEPDSILEPYLFRSCPQKNSDDRIMLQVIAQEDADHYGERTPGPGLETWVKGEPRG